jgi:hypothetical protein
MFLLHRTFQYSPWKASWITIMLIFSVSKCCIKSDIFVSNTILLWKTGLISHVRFVFQPQHSSVTMTSACLYKHWYPWYSRRSI